MDQDDVSGSLLTGTLTKDRDTELSYNVINNISGEFIFTIFGEEVSGIISRGIWRTGTDLSHVVTVIEPFIVSSDKTVSYMNDIIVITATNNTRFDTSYNVTPYNGVTENDFKPGTVFSGNLTANGHEIELSYNIVNNVLGDFVFSISGDYTDISVNVDVILYVEPEDPAEFDNYKFFNFDMNENNEIKNNRTGEYETTTLGVGIITVDNNRLEISNSTHTESYMKLKRSFGRSDCSISFYNKVNSVRTSSSDTQDGYGGIIRFDDIEGDTNYGSFALHYSYQHNTTPNQNTIYFTGSHAPTPAHKCVVDLGNGYHHFVITFSTSDGVKLYLDGNLTNIVYAIATSGDHFTLQEIQKEYILFGVGKQTASPQFGSNGYYKDIRIYDKILDSTKITALYNARPVD